jgi:F-type H+-transporting ATPase subunit a
MPELPNFLMYLEHALKGTPAGDFIKTWESMIYSLGIAILVGVFCVLAARRKNLIPGKLQNVGEYFLEAVDGFLYEVIGSKGRRFTPFVATLFIYILAMNLIGMIPFFMPATSDWSITMGLALCVFVYVEYVSFKELGFRGYVDHMMGRPRGFIAATVLLPLMMFVSHFVSEIVRPLTLSLRLRSNMWGDHLLLAIMADFGAAGLPLLIFSYFLSFIAALVQAVVFCLLTVIYFALVLVHEDEEHVEKTTKED